MLYAKNSMSQDPQKNLLFSGNAGTANIATNIDVDILNFNKFSIYKVS